VHAFSGEGIYYALKTGQIAAKTAVNAVKQNNYKKDFLNQYEKSWKKQIGKNMKAGIIEGELLLYAFKNKKVKSLFNAPTETELKEMMLNGKVPLRAKLAWRCVKHFNLLEKDKLPVIVNIIYKLYRLFRSDEKNKTSKR